jgi:MYXO-CTERM domain-containing protein
VALANYNQGAHGITGLTYSVLDKFQDDTTPPAPTAPAAATGPTGGQLINTGTIQKSGCGCSAHSESADGLLVFAAAALVLALRRRRAR